MPPKRKPQTSADIVSDLVTVRDWLRYGVSRFNAAGLVYGHGTSSALDEAAYLLLSALHLPIDALDPWLEARLTLAERETVRTLFAARIETRKPAPYLVGRAWIQGYPFFVDERVIVPRSYIGELMVRDPTLLVDDPSAVNRVLDLCTGSGCLAILAAHAFEDAAIDAVDLSPDALAVAARNVEDYGLQDRVTLHAGDLFDGLPAATGADETGGYDLIISNPPYVTAAAVAAFPPEYRSEPEMAHLGGADGLDLVRRILAEARRWLAPSGTLVVEVGEARAALEALYPEIAFLWLETETSEGEVFTLAAEALPQASVGRRRRRIVRA